MCDNQEGWVKENGFWYYYDSNGDMVKGWVESGDYWYYCYDDGSMAWDTMVDGCYVNDDGQWTKDERPREIIDGNGDHFYYYIGSDGKAVTGWNKIGDNFHLYYSPGGSMARNDTIDGFHLDDKGNIDSGTGWLKDKYSGEWYYFSDGEMTYNDTVGGYHLNSHGKMVTGTGWMHVDSWWYYLNGDKVVTDWLYDQGNWYYLYPQGSMAKGWIQYKDKWYYLNSSGEMLTGWTKYGDSWYYFAEDGKMQTGWIKDNGCWYYLNDDGSMARNTEIEGCCLDDSGKWDTNKDDRSKLENSEDTVSEIKIPDVTEKLDELMRSYEEKYKYIKYSPEPVRLKVFYDLVKNKAELDLKNQPDWKSKQFIYNGEIIENDVPGNIMYGYMGKVFGFSDTLLYAAAGYAQKQAGTSEEEWNNLTSFGDDPRDTERIKQGIKIYVEKHKKKISLSMI